MSKRREEATKARVIDEQRKEGRLPAEVDAITGKDINPHIPSYITKAPWYLDEGLPTLKHQRAEEEKTNSMSNWYKRGEKKGPASTKYREANCGAMTHKIKDCLERPRKIGARFTGSDIQADESIQSVNLGFEAKRDRWNGFNPEEQIETIKAWELIDQQRKVKMEFEARERRINGIEDSDGDESSSGDDEKYAEGLNVPGQKPIDPNAKDRTTVRNLRIREDTAKYLLNLDVDSSHYDPKTRSMRENPNQGKNLNDLTYVGDNFQRYTGDTTQMARLQVFAWDAAKHNTDIHLQANPSQAELLYKEHLKKKQTLNTIQKETVLQKYGGEEYLKAPPKELLMAQSEQYVEYSQSGQVIKGQEKAIAKSIFPLNHTSIWGSFWKNGEWGYACCHAVLRNSYCSGAAGKEAIAFAIEYAKQGAPALHQSTLTAS